MITPPDANSPIVDSFGQMVQRFRSWAREVSRKPPMTFGEGTPNGSVEGVKGQFYYDELGGVDARLYIKKFDDVGGDRTLGWEAGA